MSKERQRKGRRGEDEAIKLLENNGYKIIESNYRGRSGEVDIVARDGDALVFVEVKARSGNTFGSPKYAVDRRKQEYIIRTSLEYLSDIGGGDTL